MDIHEQTLRLLEAYPGSLGVTRGMGLFWQARIRPTAASREYLVKVVYGARPRIPLCYVLNPSPHVLVSLSEFPGRRLPHVYEHHGDPLCLFTGALGEWSESDSIADTTVPWVSLWLRFFEVWLVTNTWEGSGDIYREGKPRPALVFEPSRSERIPPLPEAMFSPRCFAKLNGLAA